MKIVRSDSPEVTRSIASTAALACWGWSALILVGIATVLSLLIAFLVCLVVSIQAAVWLGAAVFVALNVFLLWRGRSPYLNWVVAGRADRVYVRLSVRSGLNRGDVNEPDTIMLEAPEIASVSAQTTIVFLYGPKPKIIERLVIEPARTIAEDFSKDTSSTLRRTGLLEAGNQALGAIENGRLAIEWKWCRPALHVFLQQFARECPSVVVAPEEHSELDLNGIWPGISTDLNAQQRQMLVQAKRLGFRSKCTWLLIRYKYLTYQQALAYLAEIEREEGGIEDSAGCSR